MSNIKEVAIINGYPIKDKKAREKIEKPQLADFVDCDVFAQIIGEKVGFDMTGFGVQSLAIGNDTVCVGIANGTAGTGGQSKLITYDINTGSVVAYKDNLSIGHCNGMTYCDKDGCFYVACAGGKNGLNKVEVYDRNLNHIKTVDFSSYAHQLPYGIEWHEKSQSFYCCLADMMIGKFDYDFNLIEYYPMVLDPDTDVTNQTIFATDDYLFYITNNLVNKRGNYNKMYVYHIDTMKFYKKQYVMHRLEHEDCAFYKGELYLLINSQNSGLICKGSLFNDEYTGNFIPKYLFGGSQVATSSISDDYYVDSTYREFFVDNTQERPYNKLLVAVGCAIRSTVKERISFYLKGDFSDKPINIKHLPCAITIDGYGDTKPKIGGMFLQSVGVATLRNFELVTRTPAENKLLALRNVAYAWIDGVDFNGTGAEEDALWMISSTAELQNSHFKSNVTRNLIHCVLNSYIFIKAGNTYTGNGGIFIPERFGIPYNSDSNGNPLINYTMFNKNILDDTTVIPATQNFDITKIIRAGKYYLSGGSTSINCPEAIKSGGYVFTVKYINTMVEYEVIQYNGFKYKAVYSISQNKIKWLGDFYATMAFELSADTTKAGALSVSTTDLKTCYVTGYFTSLIALSKDEIIGSLPANNYFIGRATDYYLQGVSTTTGKSYTLRLKNNTLYVLTPIPINETLVIDGVYFMSDIVFNPNAE